MFLAVFLKVVFLLGVFLVNIVYILRGGVLGVFLYLGFIFVGYRKDGLLND